VKVELSPLELVASGALRREPPRPLELRPPDYEAQFDFHTIFYDCFLSADGRQTVLLGPPLFNLQDLIYGVLRDSIPRAANADVHKQDRLVQAWLPGGVSLKLPPGPFRQSRVVAQPNFCQVFAGKKVLLTKSKNNELVWIRDWAYFFAAKHGCDAVLLYDNGSTKYASEDIRETIAGVPGIDAVVVVDWPYKFGPPGAAIWDSDFCQYGILEHARHRFLALAAGVVSADIDELIITQDGSSIFDYLERSKNGYLKYAGEWIESATPALGEPRRHRDYVFRSRSGEPVAAKWSVIPSRCPPPPRGQWRVHEIGGMAYDLDLAYQILIRHFRAISTSWKYERAGFETPDPARHIFDEELAKWMRIFQGEDPQSRAPSVRIDARNSASS
jgi:hypothetical protein